ncbi:MAG: hypothetical protein QF903_02250 [Planctomycetota bacterium]|jgi:hypothetical protein|nr:hypothetical protein [Planctomycetota bacterium]MDP6988281.1 hypothetical protein [Planctomycetota bacterium]
MSSPLPRTLAIVLLACVAALGLWWRGRSPAAGTEGTGPLPARARPPAADATDLPVDSLRAPRPVAAEQPSPHDEPDRSLSEADASTATPDPPPSPASPPWSASYEHLTPSALAEALAALEERVRAERVRLFDARFESGRTTVVYPGDPPPIPPQPDPDGRLPLQEVRSVTDPASASSHAQIARLPLAEYPDFYALLAERDWLAARVGR